MFAQVWRVFETSGRLARHHLNGINGALGCRAYCVKADQRTRGHHDAGAFLFCTLDQISILQKLCDRERHEDASLVDSTDGDPTEQRRRKAFNYNIATITAPRRLAKSSAVP